MTDAARAQRAIDALRKPDASLARVPNTIRDSIAEVIEDLLRSGAVAQQAHSHIGDLTKLAAELHRSKWQFDKGDADRDPRPFDELHRIGNMALKMRDAAKASVNTTRDQK